MKILITGGSGLLGSHILSLLQEEQQDKYDIYIFDKNSNISHTTNEEQQILLHNVTYIIGDLCNYNDVNKACSMGIDGIIHCAAVVDFGNLSPEFVHNVNINGTKNIIKACMENSITSLVHISTLDTVVTSNGVHCGDGPSMPYVLNLNDDDDDDDQNLNNKKHKAAQTSAYVYSKIISEKLVLKANSSTVINGKKLSISIVRPAGMYGERDPYHCENTLQAAYSLGRGNIMQIGDGTSVFQHVYAGNVAALAITIMKSLHQHNIKSPANGEIFMGIDYTKVCSFFKFFEPYLASKGYTIPTIHTPSWLLYLIASILEDTKRGLGFIFPSIRQSTLKLTRLAIDAICVPQWFENGKAEKILNFTPPFSPLEARKRTIEHFIRREDEFPQGPITYAPGEYWYHDPGTIESYIPNIQYDPTNMTIPKPPVWFKMLCFTILFTVMVTPFYYY